MKILTRDYITLLLVSFVALVLFTGIVKAVLFGALISVSKYFFDQYLMTKINPYIDKFINWIKSKIGKK